jgi:phage terminase large subunit
MDLLDAPVRFPPPGGLSEWPPISDWTDAQWAHWLRAHNAYPFLRQWSEEAITQYLTVDRYRYGLGFRPPNTPATAPITWFYTPTPIAVPFHSSKTPNILFGGAAGGSKSHSARHDALRHCFAIPEFRAIIMRRTHEELKRNHLDNARVEAARINAWFTHHGAKFDPIQVVPSEHEIRVNVHGDGRESKIVFGHCQNEGDEEKYLGDAYDAFYPDEMATFTKKQIIGVAGRLRTNKRGVIARMGGTSNPGGAYTLWLKEWFIDKNSEKILQENPRYRPDRYEFIQAMLYDNPYYMDPDGTYTNYEERLFAYDPERRKQLLLGDWDALSGQFFPEFSKSKHVAELHVPAGCKVERWIDWGYSPHYGMCLWVAILPSGRIYVLAEWKFNGEAARQLLVASEVADRIRSLTTDEFLPLVKTKRVTRSIADPSMWGKDGHTGEDYAETFRKHGVSCQQADNDRVLGWGRLRHWFKTAPDGLPWLMIHPRCVTLIRTIPAAIRDKHDPDDIDTTCEDHPLDCCRYGVMGRPSPHIMRSIPSILLPDSPASLLAALNPVTVRPHGMVN